MTQCFITIKFRAVWSGDETICWIFDITSETKWFLTEKLRMQKRANFHLISKHSFSKHEFEIPMKQFWRFKWLLFVGWSSEVRSLLFWRFLRDRCVQASFDCNYKGKRSERTWKYTTICDLRSWVVILSGWKRTCKKWGLTGNQTHVCDDRMQPFIHWPNQANCRAGQLWVRNTPNGRNDTTWNMWYKSYRTADYLRHESKCDFRSWVINLSGWKRTWKNQTWPEIEPWP